VRIRVGSIPSILFFSLTTVLLLSFGLADDAFATADFSPVQPNAYVSYNNSTNEVQVNWDFNTGGVDAPVTCLLKGDFVWHEDLNNKHTSGVSGVDYDKVNGFIPIHYSVVSSNPTIIGDTKTTEVIPCQGSTRIDLDTVMNHSENINNYLDLEIFLSFYALDADTSITLETFNFQSSTYMDQIFVFYTPTATWSDAAKNYACAGEPGNVLYLDASASDGSLIAHGNNGDNCDQYLYIENNEYVDIGGANNDASLADGQTFYGDHDAESYSLLILVRAPTSDSGGCDDCIDPTFYYSQNKNIVKDGFRYNGFSTNVTGNLHTDIPLLFTYTNDTNSLILKVYDNFGTNAIKWIDVGFGSSGEYASIDAAEVKIVTEFSNGVIVKTTIKDKLNLINFGNSTSSIVDCGLFGTANCLQITIPHTFNEELRHPGIVIYAEDESGNEKSHYLNDGIQILGESLNESPTDKIFIQKYLGDPSSEWVDILRIDRVDNIWSSEDGIEFKGTDGGGFQRITPLGFDNTLID